MSIPLCLDGLSRLWLDMSFGIIFLSRGRSSADAQRANCAAPERAGADRRPATMLTFMPMFTTNCDIKRFWSRRLFKFSYLVPRKRFNKPRIVQLMRFVPGKRFRWNQIILLWRFVLKKRFRRNQIYVSREIEHGSARGSDSSAQVLRNSRPEFRLLSLE